MRRMIKVSDKHDQAKAIGRLYAIIEAVLQADKSLNPNAIQLASKDPKVVASMLTAATTATGRLKTPGLGDRYRDLLSRATADIADWPETPFSNTEASAWFLGYYQGREWLDAE